MMYISTLTLVILICAVYESNGDLYCKDEMGNDVDWYIVYKLPKLIKGNPFFDDGQKYAHITGPLIGGSSATKEWTLSTLKVGDQRSIFAKTLLPVYLNPKQYTSLIFNDDPAEDKPSSYWAHAKGVLAMDAKTGFFLTHSIPKFPLAFDKSRYHYPPSAANYGQTALCISFKTQEEANNILLHLQTLRPNIYYSNDAKVLKDDTAFKNVINKVVWHQSSALRSLKTNNGQQFAAFSKNATAGWDLYASYIAPSLHTGLGVETWRKGSGGKLPSDCSTAYNITNINHLEMKFSSGLISTTGEWKYTQDHAKWAVGDSSTFPITCIADINRMASQFKRGGGSLCIYDHDIWEQFVNIITDVEACP